MKSDYPTIDEKPIQKYIKEKLFKTADKEADITSLDIIGLLEILVFTLKNMPPIH